MPERRETDWSDEGERIAKYLARAGVCSRRDAEKLIEERRVRVGRLVLDSPAFKVTGSEDIRVDGRRVFPPDVARLWRYHKPSGLVTTHKDPEGRATVFEALPRDLPRVVSVGRLDLTTEGLLLLTNDGELARGLELPATGLIRTYKARAFGTVTQAALDTLKEGVVVEGIAYGPIEAVLEREQGANVWITLTLQEGKNREVRKALEHVGLMVNRLIRLNYGPFELGALKPGAVEEVDPKTLMTLVGMHIPDARQPQLRAPPVRGDSKAGAKKAQAEAKALHAKKKAGKLTARPQSARSHPARADHDGSQSGQGKKTRTKPLTRPNKTDGAENRPRPKRGGRS